MFLHDYTLYDFITDEEINLNVAGYPGNKGGRSSTSDNSRFVVNINGGVGGVR